MTQALSDNPGQQLICADAFGKETGQTIDRRSAHSTPGQKHLAIQVLVFNPKNELILHERPLKKVGGGVLDAPTTHVLKGEAAQDSAKRCIKNEYGVSNAKISILGGFSYEKDYGDGSCENEYCIAAYCVHTGKIVPDKEHVGKIINVQAKQVLFEIKNQSAKYPVWLVDTIKIVAKDKEGEKLFE